MTTDEMILDLVKIYGFRLPSGLRPGFPDGGGPDWYIHATIMDVSSLSAIEPQQAHDLCAADFARQAKHTGIHQYVVARGWMAMAVPLANGDSPAAIEALWRALQ